MTSPEKHILVQESGSLIRRNFRHGFRVKGSRCYSSELLLKITEQFNRRYIIIDALDESDSVRHKYRKPILDALSKIMASSLHIFVTSRPYPPDI